MDALFRFLVEYELLIYLILGIGAVLVGSSLWLAWREWRTAVFGLEKELSFQKVRLSGAFFILFLMFSLTQFCLVTFVAPFLPSGIFQMTPTVALLQTPSVTLSPAELTAQPTVVLAPPGSVDCVPGQIMISSPAPGSEVKGKIVISGTVDVQNFGFFKYEYSLAGNDSWATIAAGDQPIRNGELGVWDTSQITPGDYQVRLLVTDNLGKALPACIIPVRIVAP